LHVSGKSTKYIELKLYRGVHPSWMLAGSNDPRHWWQQRRPITLVPRRMPPSPSRLMPLSRGSGNSACQPRDHNEYLANCERMLTYSDHKNPLSDRSGLAIFEWKASLKLVNASRESLLISANVWSD